MAKKNFKTSASEVKKDAKFNVITMAGNNIEIMLTALKGLYQKGTKSWKRGWLTLNRDGFKNYISNKCYSGGSNLFTLWINKMIHHGEILGESISGYYVTSKNMLDLGWSLKDEAKNYSKEVKELSVMYENLRDKEYSLPMDSPEREQLREERKEIGRQISLRKIWQEIIYFQFQVYQYHKDEETGKWYIQYLKRINDSWVVERQKEVDEKDVKIEYVDKPHRSMVTRYYTVANIEWFNRPKEIKGRSLDDVKFYDIDKTEKEAWDILETYTQREDIEVKYRLQDQAFYCITDDTITLPELKQFSSEKEALATFAHECGHSTGAKKRLNREFGENFGNVKYSKEELVAEYCSMFFLLNNGLMTDELFENTLSYTESYLKRANSKGDDSIDNNLIYGLNNALKAYNYIMDESVDAEDETSDKAE